MEKCARKRNIIIGCFIAMAVVAIVAVVFLFAKPATHNSEPEYVLRQELVFKKRISCSQSTSSKCCITFFDGEEAVGPTLHLLNSDADKVKMSEGQSQIDAFVGCFQKYYDENIKLVKREDWEGKSDGENGGKVAQTKFFFENGDVLIWDFNTWETTKAENNNEQTAHVNLGAKHGIMTNDICFDKVVADGEDLFYVQSSGFREINKLALENQESGETIILASAKKKAGMHIKYVNDEWLYYSETRAKSNSDVRIETVFRINRETGAKEAVDVPGYKSKERRGVCSQLNFVGDSVLFVERRAEEIILHIYNLVTGANYEKEIDLSGNADLKGTDLSKLKICESACDEEYLCFTIARSNLDDEKESQNSTDLYFAVVDLNDGSYAATIREDIRVLDDIWNYGDERCLAIQDGYAYFIHMEDSVYLPSWNATENIYEKHLSRVLLTEKSSVPELLVQEQENVFGFNLTENELYYTVSESRKDVVSPVMSVKKADLNAPSETSVVLCMETMGKSLTPFVYKDCVYGTYVSGVATEMVDLLRIRTSDGFCKYLVSDNYQAVPDGWPTNHADVKAHIRSFRKGFYVRKIS